MKTLKKNHYVVGILISAIIVFLIMIFNYFADSYLMYSRLSYFVFFA